MRILLLAILIASVSCSEKKESNLPANSNQKEKPQKELFYVYLDSFENPAGNRKAIPYKTLINVKNRSISILDSLSGYKHKYELDLGTIGARLLYPETTEKDEILKWKFHYENKKKSQLLENQGKHFIIIGNMSEVVKDTFVNKDFFANKMYDFVEFNYPKFHLNESGTPNNIYFSKNQDNNFQLSIKTQDFDSAAHSYIKDDNLIIMIDGKTSWGNAGSLPRNEIKEISFLINEKKSFIDPKQFSNLYEISLNEHGCNVHYTYDNQIIIAFSGSDGAGTYYAFLFFDNEGKFLHKIVNLAG